MISFCLTNREQLVIESCNYSILESIKDGSAVSSKYNNEGMRFKIPNVVVFSNHMPNTRELSKDRWEVFRIVNAGLKDITIQVWKTQHSKVVLRKKMMMMINAMKTMTGI